MCACPGSNRSGTIFNRQNMTANAKRIWYTMYNLLSIRLDNSDSYQLPFLYARN